MATMRVIGRWWMAAGWTVALAALPSLSSGAVTVTLSTNDAVPGGVLTLTMSSARVSGDAAVASEQVDVTFDTAQLQLAGLCLGDGVACQSNAECTSGRCGLNCAKDARLTRQDFNATFPEFQDLPVGQRKVRLRLLAPIQGELPLPTFEDGVVATCNFFVPPAAALGDIRLAANRLEVGDGQGEPLSSSVVIDAGQIVAALPTATATVTVGPSETPTPADTATPVVTATLAATPSPTLGPPPTFVPTSTATVAVPATRTPTAGMTNTVPPSATVAATNTPSRVPTQAATATPTQAGRNGKDDDGCQLDPQAGSTALAWLGLAAALPAWGRRRFGR